MMQWLSDRIQPFHHISLESFNYGLNRWINTKSQLPCLKFLSQFNCQRNLRLALSLMRLFFWKSFSRKNLKAINLLPRLLTFFLCPRVGRLSVSVDLALIANFRIYCICVNNKILLGWFFLLLFSKKLSWQWALILPTSLVSGKTNLICSN